MTRFFLITSFLLILSGWAEASNNPSEDIDWDLSVNKVFYWPNVGARCECWQNPPEIDTYWMDSWTSDAEGLFWYSPEKYSFRKGDIIATTELIVTTSFPDPFERFDGFYFCGEHNPYNYVAYGWYDIYIYPPHGYNYVFCGIFYDTGIIPNKLLPLEIDWVSIIKFREQLVFGGFPLASRPDCFTIEKQP